MDQARIQSPLHGANEEAVVALGFEFLNTAGPEALKRDQRTEDQGRNQNY